MTSSSLKTLEEATSRYYFFGQASLAKSIIFRSIAHSNLAQNERISAVIAGYYSLFHLAISLMYFCPHILQTDQRNKMLKSVQSNIDPSGDVSHKNAYRFLIQCQAKGLPAHCSVTFDNGRQMREYLNYAPRITPSGNDAIFNTCQYTAPDFDRFIRDCDLVIRTALEWAEKSAPCQGSWFKIGLSTLDQYLQRPDLGYQQWTSVSTISCAIDFIQRTKTWLKI